MVIKMNDTRVLDELIIGRVEPKIYAFATETIPNYLKVGDTYRPVSERIKEWEKKYPNKILRKENWEWSAKVVKKDKELKDEIASYFRDFAIHKFLETDKNKKRLKPTDIKNGIYYSKEFFKDTNIKDVGDAVEDIKQAYINDENFKYDFYNFKGDKRLPEEKVYARKENCWEPRSNQQAVINNFVNAVNKGRTNLLMYAVMRFGKSFTSLMCAKAKTKVCPNGSKFIVVVSGKADIKDEWKQNVEIPGNFNNFVFLDADNLKYDNKIISKRLNENKVVVCFVTLQDLQDKLIKAKHQELFALSNKNKIDLLIIDETHFGVRAEKYGVVLVEKEKFTIKDDDSKPIDEEEANNIIKILTAKVKLHLSGTPYKILMGSEFEKEDIIAFCQFDDILRDKEKWNEEYIDEVEKNTNELNEWDNPYYGFPQMIRFASVLNKASRKRLEELNKNGIKYKLSELLKPKSIKKDNSKEKKHKYFNYEPEIREMLLAIDGSKKDNELFSFLNYDKIKEGNMCRHMVMVLPYCASCDAMEELINAMKEQFNNLNEYEIINISGVDNPKKYKSIRDIKKAISTFEDKNIKTITLTVNKMLTGVTVKEWDTMIYLKDTSSPQEYDQAIFRLQNQFIKEYNNSDGKVIKIDMKPQTLLVDYFPSRMFSMQENKSFIYNVNTDENGNDKIYDRLNEDLKKSPIILFDENGIKEVTANDIMDKVSEYSKNRGVSDEVNEIPIDLNLINDRLIYDAIKKENEIGSKGGLSFDAYEGKEIDGDGNVIEVNDEQDNESINNDNKDKVDKDEKESIRKKFKTLYSRILFYAYLSKTELKSLNDILISIQSNEENQRILKNLGLDKKVLAKMCFMDKFILRKLDYKIQNLNKLSREQETGIESAYVALKKFGRLGSSEIVTPKDIADDMVSRIKPKEYKNIVEEDERILDIASKTGEFAISLVKMFERHDISIAAYRDIIYSIPTSKVAYEFTRKIYDLLGLDIKSIAKNFTSYDLLDIKCKDENGNDTKKLDCKTIKMLLSQNGDFSNIKLDDLVYEEEEEVKFGAIIGNPPYQVTVKEATNGNNKNAIDIYQYFQNLALELSNKTCMLYPAKEFQRGKKNTTESNLVYLRIYNGSNKNGEKHIINEDSIFGDTVRRIPGDVGVFVYDKRTKNKKIVYQNKSIDRVELILPVITELIPLALKLSKFAGTFEFSSIKKVCESNFVENNNEYVLNKDVDRKKVAPSGYTKVLTNNKGGSGGEAHWYYIKTNKLDRLFEKKYKLVLSSAYPNESFMNPDNIELLNDDEFFGRTKLAIYDDVSKKKVQCCKKYLSTKFARTICLMTPYSFLYYLPNFNDIYKDFDWSKSIEDIDEQLFKKYKISEEEKAFIEKNIKPMK